MSPKSNIAILSTVWLFCCGRNGPVLSNMIVRVDAHCAVNKIAKSIFKRFKS